MKRRKILLPTDFSRNAWQAIHYALQLFKNDQCDFFILNTFTNTGKIIDNLLNMEPGSDYYERARQRSEEGLSEILDTLMFKKNGNTRHHFKTISAYDQTVEAIKDVVDQKDIELIVMGTRGETNSKSVIYGSNAINVMEKVRNCPVIVVPELAKQDPPKEIVFPTDYRTPIKRSVLSPLIEISKSSIASIKILHVETEDYLNEKQIQNKKLLEEYLEDIDHSYHSLSRMDIPLAVNCFVESRESDMVAFINSKHAFFGSILTQPLVKKVGYSSRVPILVMHDLKN